MLCLPLLDFECIHKKFIPKVPGGIGRIKAKVNSNVAAVEMVEMSHLLKDTLKVYNNLSPPGTNINSIDNDIPNTTFWPL